MHTGHGSGTGPDGGDLGGADAADLWVLDPATGEYRMTLPGELPRPQASPFLTAPFQSPPGRSAQPSTVSVSGASPAGRPAPRPAPESGPGRAARRHGTTARRGGARGGAKNAVIDAARKQPWLVGAACLLVATAVVCGAVLLNGGSSNAAASAGGRGAAGTGAKASCSALPSSGAGQSPQGGAPLPEPAVSGSFLQGPKAAAIDVRVTVLNGSGTFGQAEAVLSWMQNDRHYLRTSNGGPAPATVPTTTLVYAPNHVDQARNLAAAMGLPAAALHGDGKSTGARDPMVLTLGQDFHGIGKPFAAPSSAAPSGQATASAGAGTTAGTSGCGSQ